MHARGACWRSPLPVLALLLCGCVAVPDSAPPLEAVVTPLPLRARAGSIPADGEVCRYGVHWGFLTVGSVEYRTRRLRDASGAELLELVGITRSTGLARMFVNLAGTMRSLVEPGTLLPRAFLWTTAEDEDPSIRSIDFRQDAGRAFSVKYTSRWMVRRAVRGPRLHDNLSSVHLLRILQVGPQDEVRLLLVEGENLHLMTVRAAGHDRIEHDGMEVACQRLTMRTDRIDDAGQLLDEEPWNDLVVWVAETPARPVLRMAGRTRFADVRMELEERRIAAPEPGRP